jgi:CBS domain-containing protein
MPRKTQSKPRDLGKHAGAGRRRPAPPDPARTNRDRPTRPGEHTSQPGEGIIAAGGLIETDSSQAKAGRGSAGGRSRESTRRHGGGALKAAAQDAARRTTMPGPSDSAGPAARETTDPNFSAASQRAVDRPRGNVTRMDRGAAGREPAGATRPMPGQSARLVRDVMTADVEVANPDSELYYVARMMAERDVGAIPVVQNTDTMHPVGIITDRDIVVRAIAKNQDPRDLRVIDAMTQGVLTVTPEMSLDECVGQMEQRQIRRAVVVDETGRCCGIVAQADIARHTWEHKSGELVREISEPRCA